MTWAAFYLMCFVVGFTLSLLSFVGGGLRWHLPHFPHHSGGSHWHLGGGPAVNSSTNGLSEGYLALVLDAATFVRGAPQGESLGQ